MCNVMGQSSMDLERYQEYQIRYKLALGVDYGVGENKKSLNNMFYYIHWVKKLMKSIQKVEFTESAEATFLISECGLSLPT